LNGTVSSISFQTGVIHDKLLKISGLSAQCGPRSRRLTVDRQILVRRENETVMEKPIKKEGRSE